MAVGCHDSLLRHQPGHGDRIDDWHIDTRFQGVSVALDGPPLFWEVRFLNPEFSTEAQRFGTKEAALAFHANVVKRIMSGDF